MDDINLLPRDILQHQARLDRLWKWGVVAAVIVVLIPLGLLALRGQRAAVERRVETLRQHREQLAHRVGELKVLQAQQQQLQAREAIVQTLFRRTPLQQVFYEVAALTDDSIWLTQLQLQKGAPSPHQVIPVSRRPGVSNSAGSAKDETVRKGLLMEGYTLSTQRLADFMSGLTSAQHLSRVRLKEARQGQFQNIDAVAFKIEMGLY